MRSLHSRLIAGVLTGVSLLLAGGGVLVYELVEGRMSDEFDRALVAVVHASPQTIAPELERWAQRGPPPEEEGVLLPDPPGGAVYLMQCWLHDGQVIARTQGLGTDSLPRLATEPGQIVFRNIELPDGSPARAAGLLLQSPPRRPPPFEARPDRRDPPSWQEGPDGVARPEDRDLPPRRQRPPADWRPLIEVVVAQDTLGIDSALKYLRWILLVTWVASCLGCAAILSWLVPGSLRPLLVLREQIRTLDEARLDQRVELPGAPTELIPIVDQLNALIERIGDAFDREQAFTDHAAHELRTPVAGLRSTLEVELSRPRSAEDHRQTAEQCLTITLQMQSMIEGLLDLARLALPTADLQHEPVALLQLVEECWQPWASDAGRRGLSLDLDIEKELEPRTDRVLLRRVVANLLENAVAYCGEGGSIEVTARLDGGRLTMSVANPAPGAPPDITDHAFDAFWRADVSRSETGRHAGLGLALCKQIIEALHGRIEATYDGERFRVAFEIESCSAS